jgi:hypothetical protein
MNFSFDVFGDDPDPVVHDLEKATFDGESTHLTTPTDAQRTCTEERHERRVIRQDADLPIEGGRDYRVRFTVEHRRIG